MQYAGGLGTNNITELTHCGFGPGGAVSSDGSTCAYRYSTEGHNGYLDTYGFSIPAGATIDRNQVEYMCSWDEDPPGANSPGINIGKNEATLATEKIDGSIPIRSGGTCTVSFRVATPTMRATTTRPTPSSISPPIGFEPLCFR